MLAENERGGTEKSGRKEEGMKGVEGIKGRHTHSGDGSEDVESEFEDFEVETAHFECVMVKV
jgi:hypothetical protein